MALRAHVACEAGHDDGAVQPEQPPGPWTELRLAGYLGLSAISALRQYGPHAVAKWTSRLLEENGLIANLVEFPAVPRERARFRFQVMASHSQAQIDSAVEIFERCLNEARVLTSNAV